MASLPRLILDRSTMLSLGDSSFPGFDGIIIPQNTRKIRHIKSIEIHHQMVNLLPAVKYSNFSDDTIIMPKQRLNKIQSKSTYNLRESETTSKRVISSTTASLLIGKDEIVQNQLNLQDIYLDKYHESFYTLNHFMNVETPFFISRTFDPFSNIDDQIDIHMNNKSFTVNVYIKSNDYWGLYRQFHIKLSLLICIGDDLSAIKESINVSNMIIFKLSDDCYYSLPNDDLTIDDLKLLQSNYISKTNELLSNVKIRERTCSYDQTMKLNNFSRCIHDLMITKKELQSRITNIVEVNQRNKHHYDQIMVDIKHSKFRTDEIFIQFEQMKISNHSLIEKLTKLKELELERFQSITKNKSYLNNENVKEIKVEKKKYDLNNQHLIFDINREKAAIANTLLFVFPIEEIKSDLGKLEFQLFDIKLPNALSLSYPVFKSIFANGASGATKVELIQKLSQLSTLNIEKLNSVVGFIALIISTFANIMKIQLRYPIRFLGSHSYIHNPISNLQSAVRNTQSPVDKPLSPPTSLNPKGEVYPLFAGHNVSLSVRFVYSLILLKKDLAQLFAIDHLAKIESFNLLASLKIFLTCISSYEVEQGEDSQNGSRKNSGAVWISTGWCDDDQINHVRKSSISSTFTKTSKNIEEFNEQIHTTERLDVLKNQLRQYAK